MNVYEVELTDTFGGQANYCWIKRDQVYMPQLTDYGYTGCTDGSYSKANRVYERELMRKAKAAMGLTGIRGKTEHWGDTIAFYPYGMNVVMFIV
jgi:hypothetical protein